MRNTLFLLWHLLVTTAKLLKPGGARAVIAESVLMKHQLIVMSRCQKRAPKLTTSDRFLLGFWTLFLSPSRLLKAAVILKPSTLLKFHKALIQRKYRRLFSSRSLRKPGPKGPSQELINAIVEMKQRNPRFGSPRIAQQLSHIFGIEVNKDVVRRVLAKHYHPSSSDDGPSWLTVLGHTKDSLWSIDWFRCESINLKSHWVLLVMDQFTRRIIGFGVHAGDVDGPSLCRLFNTAISKKGTPHYLSSDNDPLFRYHRWKANLRILGVEEVKSVPYQPLSHPFVERMIGTVRRELLDQTFFWNSSDLDQKLNAFQQFYNQHRVHSSLKGHTPVEFIESTKKNFVNLQKYNWQTFCRGLFQLPVAA